jgi:hypothetical protein
MLFILQEGIFCRDLAIETRQHIGVPLLGDGRWDGSGRPAEGHPTGQPENVGEIAVIAVPLDGLQRFL